MRDIQTQYMMLAELHEKERAYALRLTDIVKTLQHEADEIIPLRPEALGEKYQAAYLASNAVVIMFDVHRHMTSKPLANFPANVMVSVIEDCTSALGRLMAEKRRAEGQRVESLERVLRELKKSQATFKASKAEEIHEEPIEEAQVEKPAAEKVPVAAPEPAPVEKQAANEAPKHDDPANVGFSFKGSYGDKIEVEELAY